ncbi:MAG: PaaI family thioesterase [Candidatus Acidiferrales bacterium]
MAGKKRGRSSGRPSSRSSEEGASWSKAELGLRIRKSVPGKLFGFELDSIERGSAVMTMQVRKRHKQVHGVVHGGILASLADTAGALAAYPLLPRKTRLATVEMKINYLEPVDRGKIVAEASLLRLGRTLAVVECEIQDAAGTLAAKALITYAISRA